MARHGLLFAPSALLGALAFLYGAQNAHAQAWPANGYYPQGYAGYPQYARPMYPAYPQAAYYNGGYPSYYNVPTTPAYGPAQLMSRSVQPTLPDPPAADAAPVANVVDTVPAPSVDGVGVSDPDFIVTPHPKAGDPNHDRTWLTLDYMPSFIRAEHFSSPLVTTGSIADVHPGGLAEANTSVLFGTKSDFGLFNGVNLGLGVFLDDSNHLSLDASGFYLFANHVQFNATSDAGGNPLITRPVFNVVSGTEVALIDAFPGVAAGSSNVDLRSELLGSELNARYHICLADHVRAEALFGFRFMRLAEELNVLDQARPLTNDVLTFEGGFVNAPNSLTDTDQFKTANHFYGLQVGTGLSWECPYLTAGVFGKVALGATDEEVDINGSTTLVTPAGNQTATGGILALPTNSGGFSRTVFGVMPEVGVTVGVNVSRNVQLTAAYSFLYWNAVVRPGDQLDRAVNPSLIPTDNQFGTAVGPTKPTFSFRDEEFWMQSLNFGVNVHF